MSIFHEDEVAETLRRSHEHTQNTQNMIWDAMMKTKHITQPAPVTTPADRLLDLRAAIREAVDALDANGAARAREVLLEALKL